MTLITVSEAAQRLQVTNKAIYAALAAGKFTRYEQYGRVLLDEAEVSQYKPIAWGTRPAGRRAGRPRNQPEGVSNGSQSS